MFALLVAGCGGSSTPFDAGARDMAMIPCTATLGGAGTGSSPCYASLTIYKTPDRWDWSLSETDPNGVNIAFQRSGFAIPGTYTLGDPAATAVVASVIFNGALYQASKANMTGSLTLQLTAIQPVGDGSTARPHGSVDALLPPSGGAGPGVTVNATF
jgi:hypothetical protein